jgi:phospholipase/lecithinase/hemolysin
MGTINETTLGLRGTLQFGRPAADFVQPDMAAQQAASYSSLYAFGDSLTDAGNDYIASDGILPTGLIYSDGRFSNGPVWVQDLAADLGLPAVKPSLNGGTDFAYGGAEAGQEPLHTVNPIDLPSQLAQFLINDPHPSANALYALSIGANDLLDAIPDYASAPAKAVADITAAVANEITFVSGLAADGARDFIIMNVPDLGVTPSETGTIAATATKLSALYDSDLSTALTALGAKDHLTIEILNAFQLIDDAVADPSKYGLKNVTEPVWTGSYENPFSGKLNATGSAQNSYLFFDHLHPTETGHTALANLALSELR